MDDTSDPIVMKPIQTLTYLLAALILLTLGACEDVTRSPQELEKAIQQAAMLAEQGEVVKAGERYQKLAERWGSPERERLQLLAAEAVLTPDTLPLAQEYLQKIDKQKLDASGGARYLLIEARILLIENRPAAALDKLPENIDNLPVALRIEILQTRADALFAAGLVPQAVEQRLALDTLLSDPTAIETNHQALWEDLMQSSSFDLYSWISEAPQGALRGWMELAYIVKTTAPKMEALQRTLSPWLQRYPQHPAQARIVPAIEAQWREYETYPATIAILLPLSGSGQYAAASNAILSGLLAAYYEESDPEARPTLKIYDLGDQAQDAYTFYTRAIEEGATFVIGPFNKTAVNALTITGELAVPTLSLNYASAEIEAPEQLYQFGLLPEDEARQVAERASLDGHENVIALTPQGEWGERILATFQERFELLGGTLLAAEHFTPQTNDYSPAIKRALGLNESQTRYRQVRNTIKRTVKFDPRRRKDVDMIFIAGSPRQARLLRPQLDFHHAKDLPVYATSHAYSGVENIRADRDLNGLIYCDIPWVLSEANSNPQLREHLDELLPKAAQRYPRLVALGIDTYHIVPYLKRLSSRNYERYEGFTGNLYIDENRRVHRELKWARFVGGRPRVLSAGEENRTTNKDQGQP